MKFEILYFDGCPTYRTAEKNLKEVLAQEGIEAEIELVAVNTDEEASRLGFPGSPTIRVEGRDLFPLEGRGAGGLSCRTYPAPEGSKGSPTAQMLRAALKDTDLRKRPERAPSVSEGERWGDLGLFGLPFRMLLSREIRRFMKVWTQTLLSPLFTSLLYIVVFGYGLGSRIREVDGIPYLQFVLPGLVLMSVITSSYGNTSSSIFDAKRERYIDDILISPITPLQMALAYVLGGVARGMLVGAGTFVLAVPLAGLPVEHPLLLLVSGLTSSAVFASVGVVSGVLSTRIDHIFFLTSIVIQPLAFLGGVFYSVGVLPAPLRVATYLDPIFYAIDAFRFAALGVSDVPPYPALAALIVFAVLSFLATVEILRRGYKLRY
ncbi:MAG: ABC transporter permease [Actinobacteria bacterium]|nr:ABC transporter permease [Actinomycetota bacterium]